VNKLRETDIAGVQLGTELLFGPEADSSRPAVFRSDQTFFFYFLSFLPASGLTGAHVADPSGEQLCGEPVLL
jgi:hypothetical protein